MRILAGASPNFSGNTIDPEFLVLHYTACNLARTLEIFADPARKVCAHFVLDQDGTLYDLGGFWDGPILQGAHAGQSHFQLPGGARFERLNLCSIGVEIVNLNGNIFPYTDAQYDSLERLTRHLQERFPKLSDPERIVGHEHIAGFRGKVDPGYQFEWARFYHSVFGASAFPDRPSLMGASDVDKLEMVVAETPAPLRDANFWSALSAETEKKFSRLLHP